MLQLAESRSSHCSQIMQCANTWQEEISTTDRSDESLDDGLLTHWLRWNAEGALGTDERVALVVTAAEHRIQKPCVLNKLELAFDLTVEAEEDESAIDAVVDVTIRDGSAVDASPAQDAMAVGGVDHVLLVFRGGCQSVARIGTAHM